MRTQLVPWVSAIKCRSFFGSRITKATYIINGSQLMVTMSKVASLT